MYVEDTHTKRERKRQIDRQIGTERQRQRHWETDKQKERDRDRDNNFSYDGKKSSLWKENMWNKIMQNYVHAAQGIRLCLIFANLKWWPENRS